MLSARLVQLEGGIHVSVKGRRYSVVTPLPRFSVASIPATAGSTFALADSIRQPNKDAFFKFWYASTFGTHNISASTSPFEYQTSIHHPYKPASTLEQHHYTTNSVLDLICAPYTLYRHHKTSLHTDMPVTTIPHPSTSTSTTNAASITRPVYFWRPFEEGTGFLGQWYHAPFTVDGSTYATCEMWMMVQKGKLEEVRGAL